MPGGQINRLASKEPSGRSLTVAEAPEVTGDYDGGGA